MLQEKCSGKLKSPDRTRETVLGSIDKNYRIQLFKLPQTVYLSFTPKKGSAGNISKK
jgi:hypothetical protein